MKLERQLADAYQQAATRMPVRPGAYDRFLRRRTRVVASATGLALVILLAGLALAAAVLPTGQPVTSRPQPGGQGQLVHKPAQGYSLTVPAGWRVAADQPDGLGGDRIMLEPAGNAARASITIDTVVLDPAQYPGGRDPHGSWTPATARIGVRQLARPLTYGRRHDGRGWVRSTRNRHWTWALAWAYRCAKDGCPRPGPDFWRALRVDVQATGSAWTEASRAAAEIVEEIRPIGNARLDDQPRVPGRADLAAGPAVRVAEWEAGQATWTMWAYDISEPEPALGVILQMASGTSWWVLPRANKLGDPGALPEFLQDGTLWSTAGCLGPAGPTTASPAPDRGYVLGVTSEEVAAVRIQVAGRPTIDVPVTGQATPVHGRYFLSPPLAPDAHVQAVTALDAKGRTLTVATRWASIPTLCTASGGFRDHYPAP